MVGPGLFIFTACNLSQKIGATGERALSCSPTTQTIDDEKNDRKFGGKKKKGPRCSGSRLSFAVLTSLAPCPLCDTDVTFPDRIPVRYRWSIHRAPTNRTKPPCSSSRRPRCCKLAPFDLLSARPGSHKVEALGLYRSCAPCPPRVWFRGETRPDQKRHMEDGKSSTEVPAKRAQSICHSSVTFGLAKTKV